EEYRGAHLGKFHSYSHQVAGDVYAVDEYTFLIKGFAYDGLGQDTFFWAGATVRPSNIGFLVPDESGRTNVLKRYFDKDITIRLPEDKKIKLIKWLSVWDIRENRNFGDIYIPDGFEPPSPQRISEFSRNSHGVQSGAVVVINSRILKIPDLNYDGKSKNAHFWVGTGPQPHSSGQKIPDERGYLNALGKYESEDIILELPGNMTVFDIDWLSIWDVESQENFGSVNIPDGLNIPPTLSSVIKIESKFPNCEQLHRKLKISWEIFGPQITFELMAQVDETDYVAFGLSGSSNSSQMIDSDVAVSYLEGHLGFTVDYNITDRYPCTNVLGLYKGVCPDTKVGGVDNVQIHTYIRENGITRITYRRNLLTNDNGDKEIRKNGLAYVVWAIGKYNKFKEPRMHYLYPKGETKIEFGRKPKVESCFDFIQNADFVLQTMQSSKMKPWGPLRVFNQTSTTFYARLGVSGGSRGYYGITRTESPGLVWYINGLLAPVLYVKRGKTYTFRVEGGNNPYNSYAYHPLYITDDPNGGYIKYTESERKNIQVYAGIEFDKKGRPSPTTAGRLCIWSYHSESDQRKADNFNTFIQFRSSLNYSCERGLPAILQWTPNASTPDVVYYQSYTQRNMGWKIFVFDDFASVRLSSNAEKLIFSVSILLAKFICDLISSNLIKSLL
ncbi:protein Skeletor: isoforms B/C-like protein, partial [Dinothrombium tinctorium]